MSTSIDLDTLYYHFFSGFYNDMIAMQQVIEKIDANQIPEAKAMLQLYVSQRKSLYQAVESHSYNSLNDIYGENVTNTIRGIVDSTAQLPKQILKYITESNQIDQELIGKLKEIYQEYYDLVFVPDHNSATFSSSDLIFINIVTFHEQVIEKHGITEVQNHIHRVSMKIKELEEFISIELWKS